MLALAVCASSQAAPGDEYLPAIFAGYEQGHPVRPRCRPGQLPGLDQRDRTEDYESVRPCRSS